MNGLRLLSVVGVCVCLLLPVFALRLRVSSAPSQPARVVLRYIRGLITKTRTTRTHTQTIEHFVYITNTRTIQIQQFAHVQYINTLLLSKCCSVEFSYLFIYIYIIIYEYLFFSHCTVGHSGLLFALCLVFCVLHSSLSSL